MVISIGVVNLLGIRERQQTISTNLHIYWITSLLTRIWGKDIVILWKIISKSHDLR